jgi:hypothetical protein
MHAHPFPLNYVSNVAQIFTILVQQGHMTENVVKAVMVMKKREKAQLHWR